MLKNWYRIVGIAGALLWSSAVLADLNTGLVAHWSFDDCTAKDVSGNGHDGTVRGAPECVTGKSGSAFTFDGASNKSFIEIPDSDQLDFTDSFSFSLWVNQKNKSSARLLDKITASTGDGYLMDTYGCTGDGATTRLATSDTACANSAFTQNAYHHIVVTVSDGDVSFYLDGKQNGSGVLSAPVQKNNLTLRIAAPHEGCDGACGLSEYFDGIIDEVRMYNRAISSAEVKTLYYQATPPTISGTAPWATPHTVTCTNYTRKTRVTLKRTTSPKWDCEAAGLEVKSGDDVAVTITGKKL